MAEKTKAQSAIEYAIIFAIVTAMVFVVFGNLASGGRVRQIFQGYVFGP